MITQYFTFGQNHLHRVNGKTFDCDCVVKISAENAKACRDKMFDVFGRRWSMQYDDMPQEMLDKYYPRGLFEI
jgi:hypothetical protein